MDTGTLAAGIDRFNTGAPRGVPASRVVSDPRYDKNDRWPTDATDGKG